jgi:hypothetical protein
MGVQPKFKGKFLFAMVVGTAVTITFACEGISIVDTRRGNILGCRADWDSNYPSQGSFSVQKPTECPFKTDIVGLHVFYAASGHVPAFTIQHFVTTDVYNWDGFLTSSYITDTWSQGFEGGQQTDIFSVSGQYDAATWGWHSDGTGYDSVYHTMRRFDGSYAHAWGIIPYVYGTPSADIAGPGFVSAGQPYTLTGQIHDASFVSPVTWHWSVDGVPVEAGKELRWSAGEEGSTQSIGLDVVDGNGATHSTIHWVSTSNGCPPPELQC